MVGRSLIHSPLDQIIPGTTERLSVRNLSIPDPERVKTFAVEDVSFRLYAGEILGIAGLRGSGKSELLNGLFGTYGRITEGRVDVDGQPYHIRSPYEALSRGFALLTNDRKNTGLIPQMNVAPNITLAALKKFTPKGWLQKKEETLAAERYIRTMYIRTLSPEQSIQTLSGGNQQKTLLARWLETSPRILLLDDPTTGVDVAAKNDIYALISGWASSGMSVLLTSSELQELLYLSNRILVLHRGRITAEFSRREASQEKIIKSAMEP
jgi:ABC-type sugar transport system ATPase subunit